ncbi:MAG: branched-chain amino acid ABC transporter permease [Eubacteriales bacterium]|nr:branched-chain amino acid ABC transporter permease [Eubacteriales bacterium]
MNSTFLLYIVDGVVLGLIYALVACGYSLIFSILRIVNFAHGSIYAFGALMTLFFINQGINPWLSVLITLILTGMLEMLMDKVCIEPLRKRNSPGVSTLIATEGYSYVVMNMLIILFGSGRNHFETFYDLGFTINIGSLPISSTKLVLLAISGGLMLLMTYIINKTHVGLAIRAVQQNTTSARLMGIKVNRIVLGTFFLAGATAAVSGALVAGYYQICYPTMGMVMGNKTLATALLGGLGAMHGGLLGGIIIGVLECIVAGTLGATYRDAVSFVVLIVILIFMPSGLFGKKDITKV